MIVIISNRKDAMKQGYQKADHWYLRFPTTYGASLETAPAFELEGGIAL